MSWTKVEDAFFCEKDGEFTKIDIGVCTNCAGIHIPPEEANGCEHKEILTYEELLEKFKKTTHNPA